MGHFTSLPVNRALVPEKGGVGKVKRVFVCLFVCSDGSVFLMEEHSILMAGYEFVPVSHKAHPPGSLCQGSEERESLRGSLAAVWL